MKTAISVPDPLFQKVERARPDLGMSRSQFYATAAQHYLDSVEREALTSEIDAALQTVRGDSHAQAAEEHERADLSQQSLRRLELLTEDDDW